MPKALLQLLADGSVHSGESLGQALRLSRAGVWKQIQRLNALGVLVISARGVGYRLEKEVELLDAQKIRDALALSVKDRVDDLDIQWSVSSTNTHCQKLMQRSPASCCICLSERQAQGRGRRGRVWQSPLASNIYLSVGWRFYGGVAVLEGLSLAVGMAIVDVLRLDYGLEDICLKWPNDILIGRKKVGGILIEMSGDASGPCDVVVGLGLNVTLDKDVMASIDQSCTDLASVMGVIPSRNLLVASLLNRLLPLLSTFESARFSHYAKLWPAYDALAGMPVTLNVADTKTVVGRMEGVSDKGELILDVGGVRMQFSSGEVSIRRD
jgi:BirA family biotin operon repressor/biotin-[acetyl-CoA-carboxylase] ligase